MKALMPYTFRNGGIVDAEAINGDLKAGSGDVGRNLARRYTYSQTIVPISGMVNSDTPEQRSVFFYLPQVSIVAVEAVIYAATGATWTVSISNGVLSDSFSVAAAGATTKASGGLSRLFAVEQGAAFSKPLWNVPAPSGYLIELSASAASTITSGYLVLHFRGDRAAGADHSGYTPTLLQSGTSSAGSVLDTQLQALQSAVTRDTNNDSDFRVECFLVRNLTAFSVTWRIPSGADRVMTTSTAAVVSAGGTATFTTSFGVNAFVGTGTNRVVFGSLITGSSSNDPSNSSSDFVVTIAASVAPVTAYVFVVWR